MVHKLALGTVQFGLNYGISNQSGQVTPKEVAEILSFCKNNELDTLDTAYLYGNSETVLGQFDLKPFNVISKMPLCSINELRGILNTSLERLKQEKIYGYLFHHFSTFQKEVALLDELIAFKKEGLIQKIGFSLYNTEELDFLLKNEISFDLIQVPYNIFDQRFGAYFSILKSKGVEIHTRSAFLQGLFFMDLASIPPHFKSVLPQLAQIQAYPVSIAGLCLNFVTNNPHIDKAVIGVQNVEQLQKNIAGFAHQAQVESYQAELKKLRIEDELIINPSKWS